jgi:azurin
VLDHENAVLQLQHQGAVAKDLPTHNLVVAFAVQMDSAK